jgi:hypothetical protein
MLLRGAASLILFGAVFGHQAAPAALPPRLDQYLAQVIKLSPADRKKLTDGAAVTKSLEGDPAKEATVFGAIWIDAPMARYVEALNDIEHLETGTGYTVTKRLSARPTIDEFSAMHLPEQDVKDLRKCRVGACDIKLDERAIQRFQSVIDWRTGGARETVDALMQRIALDYVLRYLEGGNEQLPVYRDKSHPVVVADEFRAMIGGMAEFTTLMPEMGAYLLGFPKVTLPQSSSFLYWQETVFGLKPTLRINHVTIRERKEDTVITSQMIYASHYVWTAIETRTLFPDPARGRGFWFVTSNRSRVDGLTGITGAFVRWRLKSQLQTAMLSSLQSTKQKIEQRR